MGDDQSKALLLSIEDCAALLSVGRSTVYTLIESGLVVRVKVGRRALITRRSIDQYVAALHEAARPATQDVQPAH